MLRIVLVAALLALSLSSHAVIVAGGDGTQNTTAPVDDFGFANVGRVWNSVSGTFNSGVYLGDGWVLTAYHGLSNGSGGFLFGPVVFGATSYTVDATSAVRLTTPGIGPADLALFHLQGAYPTLPSLQLSLTTPLPGSTLALMGNGLDRASTETRWDVNTATNPDTWTITAGPGDRQGYGWLGSETLRWGMNLRTLHPLANLNSGFGISRVFRTQFDNDLTAITHEAQGAPGDSGGGVFYKNGITWELSGIMIAVDAADGQPANTSVYGNQTFIADVATYRSQILSVIPEPTASALFLAGALVMSRRRRLVR